MLIFASKVAPGAFNTSYVHAKYSNVSLSCKNVWKVAQVFRLDYLH